MKKLIIFTFILSSANFCLGQTWKLGVGLQTHPETFSGVFTEIEHSNVHNPNFNTVSRLALGYRIQSEQHKAATLEVHRGFQVHFGKRFYAEQIVGLGIMYSFYSERYWYENNWYNLIYTGSKARTFDVMPSVSVGLGYRFGEETLQNNHVWIRPKVFWQLPSNNPSNPNFTMQVGYSRSINK